MTGHDTMHHEAILVRSLTRFFFPLLICLGILWLGPAAARPAQTEAGAMGQAEREKAARQSLWHLKYVIKNDGFFSQRVALNVWRANAMEAGTFDLRLYEDFKKEIYQRSIERNFRFVQFFLQQKNGVEADNCLEIWRIHSLAIDAFDPETYQSLKKQVLELKSAR